jgi:hypothetical protein
VMGVETAEHEAWFQQNYHAETWFRAADLLKESPKPWFTIVKDIKNCPNLYKLRFGSATQDVVESLIRR